MSSVAQSSSLSHATITKRSKTVRSLRRRLWRALQDEDVETAIRAYTASRQDYNAWLKDERLEEERRHRMEQEERDLKKKIRQQSRPLAIRKLSGLGKSMRNSMKNLELNNTRPTERNEHGHFRAKQSTELHDLDNSCSAPSSFTNGGSHLSILQMSMNPSDPFDSDDFLPLNDDYPDIATPVTPTPSNRPKQRKKVGPRIAGFWNRSSVMDWDLDESKSDDEVDNKSLQNMTTPLHEAARLGNPSLLSLMLQYGGNPNARNGKQRTALHMVAGGLTKMENSFLQSMMGIDYVTRLDLGLLAPSVEEEDEKVDSEEEQPVKRSVRAMSKLWKHMQREDEIEGEPVRSKEPSKPMPTASERYKQEMARKDSLQTILAWSHPNDNSSSAGEGPSINSVDVRGRTALHYAAELGRTDVCMAVLSSFGAILTIVDMSGLTPCELAGANGHADLAAQLEARALLYMDPYGMDDELMISVLTGSSAFTHGRKSLALPFSWFSTYTIEDVHVERMKRITNCMHRMKDILRREQRDKEITNFMLNHCMDDSVDDDLNVVTSEEGAVGEGVREAKRQSRDEKQTENVFDPFGVIFDQKQATADHHANAKVPKQPIIDKVTASIESKYSAEGECGSDGAMSSRFNVRDMSVQADLHLVKKADGSFFADKKLESGDDSPGAISSDSIASSEHVNLIEALKEAHIERYLASSSWNVETAMQEFEKDPLRALKESGIVFQNVQGSENQIKGTRSTCLICCDEYNIDSPNWITLKGCKHAFCSDCLNDYITECARAKETGISIDCPHHNCTVPLDLAEVQALAVSPEILESLTKAADERFIATAKDLCFCPHRACDGVVRKHVPQFMISHKLDQDLIDFVGASCVAVSEATNDDFAQLTYEGVHDKEYTMTRNAAQPLKAHRFCFACGDTSVHWPVPCKTLEEWKEKIDKEIDALDEGDGVKHGHGFDDIAQRLWMKANTRPCPKCKCPIEKNDGCNHMTCSNRHCRHEFCWICREDWKLHNTETGGFFRCNRWQGDEQHEYYDTPPEQRMPEPPASSDISIVPAPQPINPNDQNHYGTALHSARAAGKKAKEMGRFLHHYRRWTAHHESAMLESNMAETVCSRLAPVVDAAIEFNGMDDFDFNGKGLSFVHAAFTELLESRSLLQHSYVYAYFRYVTMDHARRSRAAKSREREKLGFEQIQSELEMLTEQMSDIVARKHLRATQVQIMFLTNGSCQKRSELTSLMLKLLHQQRKDAEEETAREKEEHKRKQQAADFLPYSMSSFFNSHDGHNPMPSQIRRFIESYHNRVGNDDDSDDIHEYRLFPRQNDEDAMQQAIRASMTYADGPRFSDWACGVCTYMNAGGRHCAMCGVPMPP